MPRPTTPRLKLSKDAPNHHHHLERADKLHPQPATPAVTGLSFPTPATDHPPQHDLFHSTPQDSSDGSFDAPITPPDYESLDVLWGNLRHKKELKEAKSPPKVKSLERPDLVHSHHVPTTKQTVRKKRSYCTFRESPDRSTITAIFDIPGIKKQDMHISYQINRLVVTWKTVHVTETEEDGRIIRECKESKESRTIPLPEGTKYEEVRANMDHHRLSLTYPNMRSVRAEARPKTPSHRRQINVVE